MAEANATQFTHGSIMRHVVVMSFTSSVGIMAIYVVDLLDIFFISLLGVNEMTAAAGYASTIMFFVSAINIGFSVAAGSLVARALGADKRAEARQITTAAAVIAAAVGVVIPLLMIPLLDYPLAALGAPPEVVGLAKSYMTIILPSTCLSGISMALVASLRSYGDAKWAMYPALAGAFVNLVCDPLFIFGFGWGLQGAALATVMARIATLGVAYYAATTRHDAVAGFSLDAVRRYFHDIMFYAVPSVLTSVAAPVGQAIVMRVMGQFGVEAVAAVAIIGRLTPVVFSVINALSGAIGPIIGQNAGAGQMGRVRETYYDSLKFLLVYVALATLCLYLLRDEIAGAFNAQGITKELLFLFCGPLTPVAFFVGSTAVSSAAFNNLGHPGYAWKLNWAKQTVGLLVFLTLGAKLGGAHGVAWGMAANALTFALIANSLTVKVISGTEAAPEPAPTDKMSSADESAHALLHHHNEPLYT